jgi:hypothetical protein
MKIHGNDVVRASAGEEVSNQCTSLSNPLTVPDLGLEGWWFGGGHSRKTIASGAAISTMFMAIEVAILLRLVRLDGVAASDAVGLHGAYRIRSRTAAAALVHLHLTKLVVKSGGSIGHTSALGLSWVRSLRSRVECVCAGSRAPWSFRKRGTSLVVWDIGLAGVGKERQDGGNALRGSSTAGRNGDEESKRRSGTSYNSIVRMGVLHQVIVDYTRHPKSAWFFEHVWEPFPASMLRRA